MRGEFIDVGGARLYYYAGGSRGAGDPLLLVHGFPASSFLWSRVVPLVPPGYRVVVPDLLGFGRSDPATLGPAATDLTAAGHAKRLIRLLDVLGVERATVVGHGVGASIALEMCTGDSHRTGGVGLINPVTPLSTYSARSRLLPATISMSRVLPAAMFMAGLRRRIAHLYADPAAHGPAVDHYLRPFAGPQGAALLQAHLRALMHSAWAPHHPVLAVSPAIASHRPVSIVCGGGDRLVPPTAGEYLKARLPGSTLHVVAGGHFSPEESPEQVVHALRAVITGA